MMKRIRYLLTGLLLIMGSSLVSAQDDWNPSNPPEPAVKYKVTTSASPSSCYTSGGGLYSPGQQIWINSSSYSSGYRFLYWTKNGEQYSEQQSFNYTVEEQDVAFVAYYEYNPENPVEPDGVLSYRLYLNANLPGCCSFNRGSGDKVKVGETVGLNASLNQGYKFLGWYMGDELLSESTWYNFQMPANDVTLTAMVEYSPDNPGDPPSNRPLTPIVTVKNCERVYGDANPVFEYVKNKEFAGEPVITCEADASSPVGTYTIKIERGTIENDSVVLVGGTLTITKAPLTIFAGYYTRNLGEDNPAFVPTYSGFKNDETSDVFTTQPTVSCEATKDSPIGEYDVTVSGAETTNYKISYVGGKLTVVEPYLTVTANSYSRVYGDANPNFGYTVTGGILYGNPTITCDATETSPVGTYTITIAQGDVTSTHVTYINGYLTITKAPLSIKAGDYTKKQGEDNPTFSLEYEGFKNSDTADSLTTKPTVSCDATKTSPVGEYTVTVSGAEALNYEISYVNGKLIIETDNSEEPPLDPSVTLKVSVTDCSRMYGDSNPTFEYVKSSDFPGEPIITCEAVPDSPVGTYTIKIERGSIEGENLVLEDGELTITKAPLTIKAGDYKRKQGEDNPVFAPTYEGFKNSDSADSLTIQPTISCDATKTSPIGEYTVTVCGAEAMNYEISYVNGKLTIEEMTFVSGGDDDKDEDDAAKYRITTEDDNKLTVSVAGSDDVKGKFEIPQTVTYNGVNYVVTEISDGAFENNTMLTDVIIPASIESIKDNAFKGCTNLNTITIYVVTPIVFSTALTRGMITRADGTSVFEGVNKETCILYVPEGSVDLYKAANVWKDFVNILPIGSTGINGIVLTNDNPQDVYDLHGCKVKSKTTTLEGLHNGIYIVNGKKQLIKR